MKIKQIKQKRGFTLIELLVVITIIAVLSAVGMVMFTNAGKSSRDAKRKADLESIRQALVLYRSDNGCYPGSLNMSTGDPLIAGSASYISSPFPTDPRSPDQDYTYIYVSSGPSGCKNSFFLKAKLESDGTTYTLTNP
jgi:general secretion pathway protein G